MPIRTFIVVFLALVAVSGCGRRGGLELPDTAATAQPDSTAPASAVSTLDPGSSPATDDLNPAPPPPAAEEDSASAPKKRFFLDFLL
jgi:predicted small lipoprotein YifL